MTSILDKIAAHKRHEVIEAQKKQPLSLLRDKPLPALRPFISALENKPAIIAEIKKASPSKGLIREDFDVASIASIYEKYGAHCISVLTDRHFFQGDATYLAIAKEHSKLPLLRKDFIIDPYQIEESRFLGADCILLIVAMLDDYQLLDFCQEAQHFGLAVLVESHTQDELQRALRLPTPLMGINNRSLHTFHTDLQVCIDLAQEIPTDKLVIAESGIETAADIKHLQSHGIHRFLIGESLMRAPDIASKLQALLQG